MEKKINGSNTLVIDFSNVDIYGNLNVNGNFNLVNNQTHLMAFCSVQSIGNRGSFTRAKRIRIENVIGDIGGIYDSTGDGSIKIPSGKNGYYKIAGIVYFHIASRNVISSEFDNEERLLILKFFKF